MSLTIGIDFIVNILIIILWKNNRKKIADYTIISIHNKYTFQIMTK